jgi:hypothetical protein
MKLIKIIILIIILASCSSVKTIIKKTTETRIVYTLKKYTFADLQKIMREIELRYQYRYKIQIKHEGAKLIVILYLDPHNYIPEGEGVGFYDKKIKVK